MRPSTRALLLATSALVPLPLVPSAHANPVGASVAAGTAQVAGEGTANLTVNQATDKAIINWHSFDIGAGETTQFVQPSTNSVTLNRVTGGLGSSQIDGALKADGEVFLINPDGILFGPHSVVDVGGLVATTHDIKNDDFMAGRYVFGQLGKADASVVNAGSITAATGGFAALVAPGVRNSGTITARLGRVGLAAANHFTLDFYGDQLLTLNVGDEVAGTVKDVATGETLDALVKNEGALKADGGVVQLTAAAARQVVDSVINTKGIIEADSVGIKNGKIVLSAATADSKPAGAPTQKVKVSGTLSVAGKNPGETGGKVQITGEDIALNGAIIDASGKAGGGTVLVGGDVSGGHPNPNVVSHPKARLEDTPMPTATNVTVDPTSKIDVSATDKGDGGKAVVWADFATDFAGTGYAKAGDRGGDGGFVEISGKQHLHFGGAVVLEAPIGAVGTLLLDPLNVIIGPGGLSTTTLGNAIATGNVVVSTDTAGADPGDITVAQSFSTSSSNALTLVANNDIIFNDGVVWSNPGGAVNLTLRADSDANGSGNVVFNGTSFIDGTGSTGSLTILYNPPGGYAHPTNFAAHLVGWTGQFSPYMLVNNLTDLQAINQNLGGTYALGRSIDASESAAWNSGAGFIPIGAGGTPFYGTFDGQGRTIDRITIHADSGAWVGLFSWVGSPTPWSSLHGTVRSVALTNVQIHLLSSGAVGGLAGMLDNGTILDSNVTGEISGVGADSVGALAGILQESSTILRSSANATVTGGDNSRVGVLVGHMQNYSVISESNSSGIAIGGASSYVGGLAGTNGSGSSQIQKSYSTADVSGGLASLIGGLVGFNTGKITDSYATGTITGGDQSYAGSLVGENYAFCGTNNCGPSSGVVQSSYGVGSVSGGLDSHLGGLIGLGMLWPSDIGACCATWRVTNSYWDMWSTGQASSPGIAKTRSQPTTDPNAGGSGLTTAELRSALPTGFDSAIWGLDPTKNDGYPYLLWQTFATPISPSSPASAATLPTSKQTGLDLGQVIDPADFAMANSTPAVIPELDWKQINPDVATSVLPFAAMASDAYGQTSWAALYGFHLVSDSTIIFGNDSAASRDARESDFYAVVFASDETHQLVVAFRGTVATDHWDNSRQWVWIPPGGLWWDKRDYEQNVAARTGRIPTAYELAAKLAVLVNTTFRNSDPAYADYSVVLTGHSLGGGEASYAAGQTGLSSITFNASRNAASDSNPGLNQTNLITSGDVVGDPLAGVGASAAGSGFLNGATYRLDQSRIGFDAHDIKGIIDALLVESKPTTVAN